MRMPAAALLFFAFAFILQAAVAASPVKIIEDARYARPQRLIEVEPGRRLNLFCQGHGSPTVIFESGLSDETSVWGFVQPIIATRTRTCSYDRAGIGFSDPAMRPGTSAAIVADLHALLGKASIKPPYVLVGHSYGGMNAVLFADLYPSQVAGMVLVDPAHEDQVRWQRSFYPHYDQEMLKPALDLQRQCIDQSLKGFAEGTDIYKKCVGDPDPRYSPLINDAHHALYMLAPFRRANLSEMESIRGGASGEQVRAARRKFGDMPLIVLTRSPPSGPLSPGETPALRAAAFKAWVDMHDDLASRSSRGRNEMVESTGHYIQFDQPGVVNRAINGVLDEVAKQNGRKTDIGR